MLSLGLEGLQPLQVTFDDLMVFTPHMIKIQTKYNSMITAVNTK